MENEVRQSFDALKGRVESVARRRTRVQTADGASRAALAVLVPLLATLALDRWVGLHYLLRAGIVIAVAAVTVFLLVRRCLLPLLKRYTLTEAAMLVELGLPDLNGRVVSSLEVYEDLDRERPRFDRGMVRALISYAQDSTREQDFGGVVDRRGLRRHSALAAAFAVIAIGLAVMRPDAFGTLFSRLVGSFSEVSQFARKIAGASIEVKPGDATILRGQNVALTARQLGFHSGEMMLHVRREGEPDESVEKLAVSADGKAETWLTGQEANFVYYFSAEKVRSRQYTIKVTDRPRITNIRIEYDFPSYVRRAPVVVGRSDGRIEALFGCTVIITLEANKPLQSARMSLSYDVTDQAGEKADVLEMTVGGTFARATIRLDNPDWLALAQSVISESYSLLLTCEDGFRSENSDRLYPIVVKKDQPPEIAFVRLPNRSPEHEVHVLDTDVSSVGFYVDARDDYGLQQITFHYVIEDLLSNAKKREDVKKRVFQMPQSEFNAGLLARLSELRPEVGDRVVFWAETQDAYDLEPEKGPHVSRTPAYRMAIVTKEELFEEVLYSDDWSTTWYDPLKVATLSRRAAPPRTSPTNEKLASVAELLLQKAPGSNRVSVDNQRLVEDYFNSINVSR
ncbi:MAG TPA: hypothetical protein VM223_26470 [Planctomycetota bacterium]|nr:hypothetical protein [Planctomycetota bacterium]